MSTNERDHRHAIATESMTSEHQVAPGKSNCVAELLLRAQPRPSGLLQRKARDGKGVADGAGDLVASAAASSGAPLPTMLMRKFEASLGADLSGVRVHTGGASEAAADAVGARAYALGPDIHFGAGQYNPSSTGGEHLLAHEVAHTVQQSGGVARMQLKPAVSSPGDFHELEADRAADAMVCGGAFAVSGAPSRVARDPKGENDASITASPNGVKVSLKSGVSKEFNLGEYAKAEIGGEFSLEGSLEKKEGAEGDKAKENPETDRAEATEKGTARAKQMIESGELCDKSWFHADLEMPEIERGKESGSTSVTIKLKVFGKTIEVKPTLVEVKEGKIEGIGVLAVEVPFEMASKTLWENANKRLVVSEKFTIKGKVSPDWKKIAAKAMERFGNAALDAAGSAAMTVLEAMGSIAGMTAGFVAMGATMVLAGYMDAVETDNIDAAVAKGQKEIDSAVSAAMDAYGVRPSSAAGEFAGAAYTKAWNQVAEAFAKAHSDPKFAEFHFDLNDPKLRAEIANRLAPSASDLENRARRAAIASVSCGIAQQYYDQHYDDALRTDGHTRVIAETICARLGGDSRWSPDENEAQKAAKSAGKGALVKGADTNDQGFKAAIAGLNDHARTERNKNADNGIRDQQNQDAQNSSTTRDALPPALGSSAAPQQQPAANPFANPEQSSSGNL